ncbi:MAG: hypothetical protein ABFE07_21745 [Armatimonadia bacterium]
MPSEFLNEINRTFLQVIPVLVEFVAIVWLAAWVSERFIATLPDDVPEKAELLQGARNRWFIWAPLASLAVMYAMIVYALAPLSGVVLGAFVMLLPILLMAYANPAALDAPSAAVEVLRARLRRQAADPERWVARYRLLKARRQRLGLLKWAMAALMALLAVMGVYGYVTVDRVLAMRLQAQVVEEALRADLSTSFEGTIFSQTPPCVPLRTMYLIPGKDLSKAQAQSQVERVVKWFGERGERWPWQVRVKTGDGPPLAEGEYAGRR